MARSFGIGRHESESVSNLMVRIHPRVVEELAMAVRSRGMAKFLTHECLAKDLLNTAWSSGIAGFEAWKDFLRNDENAELVSCRLSGLCPLTTTSTYYSKIYFRERDRFKILKCDYYVFWGFSSSKFMLPKHHNTFCFL